MTRVRLTKLEKAHIKYESQLGTKFGRLFFREVTEVVLVEKPKKTELKLTFVCNCGVVKEYSADRARQIFAGDTLSCGCLRKEKWRKSYYAFMNGSSKKKGEK